MKRFIPPILELLGDNMLKYVVNIPNPQQAQRIVAAINGTYPMPVDDKGKPEFTPQEWATELIQRQFIGLVARFETREARKAARVLPDKTLVSVTLE